MPSVRVGVCISTQAAAIPRITPTLACITGTGRDDTKHAQPRSPPISIVASSSHFLPSPPPHCRLLLPSSPISSPFNIYCLLLPSPLISSPSIVASSSHLLPLLYIASSPLFRIPHSRGTAQPLQPHAWNTNTHIP